MQALQGQSPHLYRVEGASIDFGVIICSINIKIEGSVANFEKSINRLVNEEQCLGSS